MQRPIHFGNTTVTFEEPLDTRCGFCGHMLPEAPARMEHRTNTLVRIYRSCHQCFRIHSETARLVEQVFDK